MPALAYESTALTPPKWVAAVRKREKPVLLEERLWEFAKWLADYHIKLAWANNGTLEPLSDTELDKLIQEYVNT